MNRRHLLHATAATTAIASLGTNAAAEDDDEETTHKHGHDECENDDGCGDDNYCPLDNTIVLKSSGSSTHDVYYDIVVTGEIELKSGERVERCRGTLQNEPGGSYGIEFSYSGELKCLNIEGEAYVELHQDHTCE